MIARRAARLVARSSTPALAYWALIVLVVVSLTLRPTARLLGLPGATANLDAAVTPLCVGVVVLHVLLTWRNQSAASRWLTAFVGMLAGVVVLAWLAGSPRTWASAALGFSVLPVLPLALYLAAQASSHRRSIAAVTTLRIVVLLQVAFGVAQYVADEVPQHAPYFADLVNGTSSHNLWPAFALPASLVLALVDRGAYRLLWPAMVAILAIYAEAKAALVIWLPAIALVAVLTGAARVRRLHPSAWRREAITDRAVHASLGLGFVAVLVAGLWWSPSVEGTWDVLQGHTRDLATFASDGSAVVGGPPAPTLDDSLSEVSDRLDSPSFLLLGLGPGNSVSHAAEILAKGPANGVGLPPPGPVARRLLSEEGTLQFEDSQSTALGLFGDLGALGVLAYGALLLLSAGVLVAQAMAQPRYLGLAASVVLLIGGVLGGGLLLDWPEQATIALPVSLAVLIACRAEGRHSEALAAPERLSRSEQRPADAAVHDPAEAERPDEVVTLAAPLHA